MGRVPSVQVSDPVQSPGVYRWAAARSVRAGLDDVPAAGMREEGYGLGMATGPRRRACQTPDEKFEALRTIRGLRCVCMFACVHTR